MSKDELLTWIAAIQNSLMVGMAAIVTFEHEEVWPLLDSREYGFVPNDREMKEENVTLRMPVYYVGEALRNEELRGRLLFDFREFLLRNALAETLEHVKEYCTSTDQITRLRAAEWYHFARVLRNALAHDSVIRFDRWARPPLTFQLWTISPEDAAKHISQLAVPSSATVPLLVAIHDFVATLN